jgi:uncharacterized repeat protein (TIGR01451 family)
MDRYRRVLHLTLCIILSAAVQICPAATLTCAAGDVACLTASILSANSTPEPDTIQLAAGTYLLTTANYGIANSTGLPPITSVVTIQGAGIDQTVIVREPTAPRFRHIEVAPTATLTVQGVTLTGGNTSVGGAILNYGTLLLMDTALVDNRADGGGGLANNGGQVAIERSAVLGNLAGHPGGGLDTYSSTVIGVGSVTVRDSTFAENFADGGAAISNGGSTVLITNSAIVDNMGISTGTGGLESNGVLRITNTTLARNIVLGRGFSNGSGALTVWGGDALLTNCTIVDNTAPDGAGPGGIIRKGGVLALRNTILARNTGTLSGDCAGVITSQGHNLIGDPTGCTISVQPSDLTGDPDLDAYADDGLPGHGHYPPLPDSPVINAGNDAACPPQDQLGHPRAGTCDIGAVEFQSPDRQPPVLALTLNQTAFRPGETLRLGVHLRNPGPILTTDAYVGVILPDGETVLWLTNTAPLEGVVTRLDSNPRTFRSMLRSVSWPAGLDATQPDYLTYTFTGGEAPGTYYLLVGWTKPGSLDDGRIDEGDILALDWKALRFTGEASTLAAKARD